MSNYLYVLIKRDPHAAVLGNLGNVEKTYQLLEDVPRSESFSTKALFDMDPDYGLQLRDFVMNGEGLLVVSEQVKAFAEAQDDIRDVEMLPVTIINHKGRAVDERYYIMHLLGFQDCIDTEQSEVVPWASEPENFQFVYDLTLNEERIDPEKALFRLEHYPDPVIVRRDLAQRIEEAGLTGIKFDELLEFDPLSIL